MKYLLLAATWVALFSASLFAAPTAQRAAPATRPAGDARAKPDEQRPTARAASAAFSKAIEAQLDAALGNLEEDGDFARTGESMQAAFDQVIRFAADDAGDLFSSAALGVRLVRQLSDVPQKDRRDLLRLLRRSPRLAQTLCFLMDEARERGAGKSGSSAAAGTGDRPAGVFAMLAKVRAAHDDKMLEDFAELTAAVCVVHDRPLHRQINENKTDAPDPIAIFDYFSGNEKQMFFGIKNVPAELLVYVVDTTASINEMRWALQKYKGDPSIGRHFFDVPYDYSHFLQGTPKKVTSLGYNLPNILKLGGVCADQAYFAESIGKAIGVPTASCIGRSGTVGHAWVGFVQVMNRRARWNFESGRYSEYLGVRGDVIDPQTGRSLPDSQVSLLSDLVTSSAADRHAAAAFTDAAHRLMELRGKEEKFAPNPPDGMTQEMLDFLRSAPRSATLESELALLELGIRRCPAYALGWLAVRDRAQAGDLAIEQKQRWSAALLKLCGEKYPDFVLEVLTPMVQTVEQPAAAHEIWEAAMKLFKDRPDLSAAVRMQQASVWEKANLPMKAGLCYQDILKRYPDAGPFVIDALEKAESILRAANRDRGVLELYKQTWSSISRPPRMASPFLAQSNWIRVGQMYADRLQEAGDTNELRRVQTELRNALGANAAAR